MDERVNMHRGESVEKMARFKDCIANMKSYDKSLKVE